MKTKKNIKRKAPDSSKMSNITQKWVNLLIPFTSGYGRRFTQSELSRLTGIPQQTSSRYLDSLVKKGLISYEIQGRNKLFYIDLSSPSAGVLLQIIENHKTLMFQSRVKDASIIISELLAYAESIILFGSYASYKFKGDSDMDLVITGKSDKNRIKAIKQKFPVQVNEHYVSYKELSELLKTKKPLAVEIMRNHIVFGEVSKIVCLFMEGAQ